MDGDTDSASVQREFEKVVRQNVQRIAAEQQAATGAVGGVGADFVPRRLYERAAGGDRRRDGRPEDDNTIVQDLEGSPIRRTVATISHHVSLVNGQIRNSDNNNSNNRTLNDKSNTNNDNSTKAKRPLANGFGPTAMAAATGAAAAAATATTSAVRNGHLPNGKPNFRNILEEADNIPIHAHM